MLTLVHLSEISRTHVWRPTLNVIVWGLDLLKYIFFIELHIEVVLVFFVNMMVAHLLFFLTDRREEVKLLDPELVRRLREFVGAGDGNLDSCNMATLAFLYIYLSLFGSR